MDKVNKRATYVLLQIDNRLLQWPFTHQMGHLCKQKQFKWTRGLRKKGVLT